MLKSLHRFGSVQTINTNMYLFTSALCFHATTTNNSTANEYCNTHTNDKTFVNNGQVNNDDNNCKRECNRLLYNKNMLWTQHTPYVMPASSYFTIEEYWDKQQVDGFTATILYMLFAVALALQLGVVEVKSYVGELSPSLHENMLQTQQKENN